MRAALFTSKSSVAQLVPAPRISPLASQVRRVGTVSRAIEGGATDAAFATASALVQSLPEGSTETIAAGLTLEAGLVGAGAALIAVVGGALFAMRSPDADSASTQLPDDAQTSANSPPPPPPRENAVLVLGSTGRVGRRVVERLLRSGRTVVAAARNADLARSQLITEGGSIVEGRQPSGSGILFFESVDLTSEDTLRRAEVWKGVTQIISVVGRKSIILPGGGFGTENGLTSEVVEAQGIARLVSVLPDVLPKMTAVQYKTVLPMGTSEEVAMWERMDDVIMGGNSSSAFEAAPDVGPTISRWKGQLVLEGGGFCGSRTKTVDGSSLANYDGIAMRVKGDGSIFKLNIKTTDQLDRPESTYQTTFDTVDGQWHDVMLPWHNFVPVQRAQSDPEGAPLNPSKIAKFGMVLSRFEFNKMPNPIYKEGPFELLIDGGLKAYKGVRPQIVSLSSAGVERNAVIADDEEKRKRDIPIVQLNPEGTLNHKYSAEISIRDSGYPYAIVRATGTIDSQEGGPYMIEADQGDTISGTIGRDEVADVITAILGAPEAAGKTFEIRRNEAADAKVKSMKPEDYTRMLLKLELDRNRWRVGLKPFPKFWPYPKQEVTEERRKEILAEVQRVRDANQAALSASAPARELVGAGGVKK